MLVAAQGGVHVPTVIVAGRAGSKAALLVERPIAGVHLADLDADDVSDVLLARLWTDVDALGQCRIAHGDLDADHVIVNDQQPWIVGFDEAEVTGDPLRHAADVAEMLASTAALVGDERAVRAAVTVLGRPTVALALPLLQPAALSSTARKLSGRRWRGFGDRLEHLREVAAAAIGIEPPELVRVRRITATGAAMALGAFVAVGALLLDVGDPTDVIQTMQGADWGWIAFALVLSLAANVAYAVGLQGTVRVRLPLVPTTELQVAMSFSNLAVPAIGGQGMQVRFLQKMGVDLSSAIAAGGVLSSFGALVAAFGCFAVALIVEPARVDLSLIPTNGLLLTLVVVGGDRGVGERTRRPPARSAEARDAAAFASDEHDDGGHAFSGSPGIARRGQRGGGADVDLVPAGLPDRLRGTRFVLGSPRRERRRRDDRVDRAGPWRRNRGGHGRAVGGARVVRRPQGDRSRGSAGEPARLLLPPGRPGVVRDP